MASASISGVELEDEFYHARVRDPGQFDEIRTPGWASTVADDVYQGSEVRMGRRGDDWVVQSILVPKNAGKSRARSAANQILTKLED